MKEFSTMSWREQVNCLNSNGQFFSYVIARTGTP